MTITFEDKPFASHYIDLIVDRHTGEAEFMKGSIAIVNTWDMVRVMASFKDFKSTWTFVSMNVGR